MNEIPNWVIIAVGIANIIQIFSALTLILLGVVGIAILLSIKNIVTQNLAKDIMPSVTNITRNVEKISEDAANTTHNVTGAVNRVSNLVGTASSKLESPVIRAVGLASGVLAAGRSIRGKGKDKTHVIVEKKRRGFFG